MSRFSAHGAGGEGAGTMESRGEVLPASWTAQCSALWWGISGSWWSSWKHTRQSCSKLFLQPSKLPEIWPNRAETATRRLGRGHIRVWAQEFAHLSFNHESPKHQHMRSAHRICVRFCTAALSKVGGQHTLTPTQRDHATHENLQVTTAAHRYPSSRSQAFLLGRNA